MVLPIPIFVFTSPKVSGLLTVNGRIAGEIVRGCQVSVPLSNGVQYVGFQPLQDGALPFTRRIAILGGQVRVEENEAPVMRVISWPGGVHEVEISPPQPPAYAPLERRVVDSLRWQDEFGAHKAALLSEGVLVLELESDDGARFAFIPECAPKEGRLALHGDGSIPLATPFLSLSGATGEGGEYLVLLTRTAEGFAVLLDRAGDRVVPPESGVVQVLADLADTVGHGILCRHDWQGAGFEVGGMECVWIHGRPQWPRTAEQTVSAFVEAVCLDSRDEALGYLAPEVRARGELVYDGLLARLSEYTDWAEPRYLPTANGTSIALLREVAPGHRVADICRFLLQYGGEQGDFAIASGCFWDAVGDGGGEQIDFFD